MMKRAIKWSTKYEIGVQKIDEQHEQLFTLLEFIDLASKSPSNREQLIDSSLKALIDYTQTHFKVEEATMSQIQYPLQAEHEQLHQELLSEVESMIEEVQDGEYLLIDELILFILDWLREHILVEDKKVGDFIKQHNHTEN